MPIERNTITITAANPTKDIKSATANKRVKLLALVLSTEAADAEIEIQDTSEANVGGVHHLGAGTAGNQHAFLVLQHNPNGWALTDVGKGLMIKNVDSAVIDGLAIIDVID